MAAEGAILNEMLEIVAKRAALRPTATPTDMEANINHTSAGGNLNMGMIATPTTRTDSINLLTHGQSFENSESNVSFLKSFMFHCILATVLFYISMHIFLFLK